MQSQVSICARLCFCVDVVLKGLFGTLCTVALRGDIPGVGLLGCCRPLRFGVDISLERSVGILSSLRLGVYFVLKRLLCGGCTLGFFGHLCLQCGVV